MDITIVIPNLNGASVLPATLAAVAAGSGLLTQEVVRVDNASTDESVA
ncbi:MAG: glycosyltransferase [Candidatus Sericytochromatia bacterium]|nr:glycosyltransferase [Candidatus Tanganyikabacteria bacterium]